MRKCLILLLCLCLLCPASAAAAEGPKLIALSFEGFPAGASGRGLLEGLADRDARATFFLWDASWEQGRQILDGGHEIGLLVPPELKGLSRRAIASELKGVRALLPPCRICFIRAGADHAEGLRQVAKAQGLTILEPTLEPWAEVPGGRTILDRVAEGDILVLDGAAPVNMALNLVDLLQNRGFRIVTASELAWLRPRAQKSLNHL